MLNLIKHLVSKTGKSLLPNPNLEYRLVFKRGAIETIKRTKGWKTDAEMARALGLTRAYITMLHRTRVSVTSTVITRLAVITGNMTANWWIFYELVPWGVPDLNHPIWNYEKYMGRQPYNEFSAMGNLKKLDYDAEIKEYQKNH